ncbi:MBL fold metallo-hydrolase [Amycolatopsis suaedae]|uniref:MBL fold metallo-hydrolase n=1 Tax=Amycolatopsis suaedae TaxID=2510978 RepID=A0A4Q7J7W9_9PSEU|nr:MBL fold metallo-hydrolase [Amycolatopsis suaedae]RZQ63299.1 MBL fold metallo-hydrolase [Amycolatopsis suaedae]
MKVHHLNCGTFRPPGGRLLDGTGGLLQRAELVCHCLLLETDSGLVLVDTGFGTQALTRPGPWLGALRHVLGAKPVPAENAIAHVRRLGHDPRDVRHIVLTHLDMDHAGGLADFPEATVHVYAEEHRAATEPRGFTEKSRYRAVQFAHSPKWTTYETAGEPWFGFDAVRELAGLGSQILLVPLAGHTNGHAGVAVDTGDGWLLHAGDSYFHFGQLDPTRPHCPPLLAGFQEVVQMNRANRLNNIERLRELYAEHGDEVTVFSAHNSAELRSARR